MKIYVNLAVHSLLCSGAAATMLGDHVSLEVDLGREDVGVLGGSALTLLTQVVSFTVMLV